MTNKEPVYDAKFTDADELLVIDDNVWPSPLNSRAFGEAQVRSTTIYHDEDIVAHILRDKP